MKLKLLTHSLICNLKFSLFSSDDVVVQFYFFIAPNGYNNLKSDERLIFLNLIINKFVNYNVLFSRTVLSPNRRKFQTNTDRF